MEEPTIISSRVRSRVTEAAFMTGVYGWMFLALLVTSVTAFITASTPALLQLIFGSKFGFYALIFGEIGLVWYLSARVSKMSNATAIALFMVYSVLNGLTLSAILLVFTGSLIGTTFAITSLTFGVMSAAGYFTKKDLTGFGSLMMMGLIGIIIASLINFFVGSSTLDYIISYVGVLVFVGLTAYDTQKIKQMALVVDESEVQRASIIGALSLYLDFINLFLMLLRIFDRD